MLFVCQIHLNVTFRREPRTIPCGLMPWWISLLLTFHFLPLNSLGRFQSTLVSILSFFFAFMSSLHIHYLPSWSPPSTCTVPSSHCASLWICVSVYCIPFSCRLCCAFLRAKGLLNIVFRLLTPDFREERINTLWRITRWTVLCQSYPENRTRSHVFTLICLLDIVPFLLCMYVFGWVLASI